MASRWFPKRIKANWAGAACLCGAAGLLYAIPPGPGTLYPPCLFRSITGVPCPGCGLTHAAHLLLHGDWTGAWSANPLALFVVPSLGLWLCWLCFRPSPVHDPPPWSGPR